MKSSMIQDIISSDKPVESVLIRNGGWHGDRRRHLVTMRQPWGVEDDTWGITLATKDGILLREVFVDAENILGVTTTFTATEFD